MEGDTQKQLTSKLQYKNFEPGEFTCNKQRNYEQTIRLIEDFPWEEQRDHLQIGMSSPSITIEGEYRHFIKLALYYNDSFALYYLDDAHRLYLKKFDQPKLAYPYIQSFFADSLLDTADMELQHFVNGKSGYFKDKSFRYTVRKTFLIFLFLLLGLLLPSIPILITGLLSQLGISMAFLIPALLFTLIYVIIVVQTAQLINHFRACAGKELILSGGKDTFYYGKTGQPEEWAKKDIVSITCFSRTRFNSNKDGTFARIDFRSSDKAKTEIRSIYIPSIIILETDLLKKFPSIKPARIRRIFPFIPLSSSIPS